MFTSNLTRFLALGSLALGLFTTAYAEKINPTRVGPVSQYGQLQAGKNAQNEGRIYGSCKAYSTSGNEVQVKGMSLFWSCAANQQRYWKEDVITGLVQRQNIQLIRAAMAVDNMGEWADGHYFTKPDFYQTMLDEAVEAAIKNDIYVIIDFHSHVAADSVENAKAFFRTQAQKWGSYDNVIFEIYNEPICKSGSVGDNTNCAEYGGFIDMEHIKIYADQVVSVIREYSDNLIIVGTPMWDQYPNQAINYPVEDPLERDNIAYAFHYYAGRDDGSAAHSFSLSSNADKAMQSGLSVFVSEWGTVGYDGAGAPSTELNPQWQNWMNSKKISSANWNAGISGDPSSVSGSEYFAYSFDPDNAPDNWTYSTSGQWVNTNVFAGLPTSYTTCAEYVPGPPYMIDDFENSEGYGDSDWPYMEKNGTHWSADNVANVYGGYDVLLENAGADNSNGIALLNVTASNIHANPEDPSSEVTEYNSVYLGKNVNGLPGCAVISYQYKGAGHTFTLVDPALDNEENGYDFHHKVVNGSDTWKTVWIDVSKLEQWNKKTELNVSQVSQIRWVLEEVENASLYIDNIRCAAEDEVREYVIENFDGDKYTLPNWAFVWEESSISNSPDGYGGYNAVFSDVGYEKTNAAGIQGPSAIGETDVGASLAIKVSGLKGCEAIQYKYKGGAHDLWAVVNNGERGPHSVGNASSDWTTETLLVSELNVNPSEVTELRWGFPYDNDEFNYLYIDDVECVKAPASSSSSSIVAQAYLIDDFNGKGIKSWDYVFVDGDWSIDNTKSHPSWSDDPTYMEYDRVATDPELGTVGAVLNVTSADEGAAGLGVRTPELEGCATLRYKYKGHGHTLQFFNEVTQNNETINDNFVDASETPYDAVDEWTTNTYDMNQAVAKGLDLSLPVSIQWYVDAPAEGDNFYVADVRCVTEDEPQDNPPVELPDPKTPTTNTELVDDFEDGDFLPLWDVGTYWTETDVVGGGGASTAELSIVKGNNSSYALQMSYSLDVGGYPWGSPYVTISTNDFANMNLSQCTEVRYDYKGAAHKFRLKVSSEINNLLDMDWGYPTFVVSDPSESWQTVTIPVASLRQGWTGESGNWVGIETVLPYANGFDWRVEGEDESDKSSGTLAIDNIRCVGLAETQYYTVMFKNGEETLEEQTWAENSNLPDPGLTPIKESTAQYSYTFDYWENFPETVTDDAVCQAHFDETLRAYTVTFLMDDGETPVENGVVENVPYETHISEVKPANPTKEADAQFTYTFGGWDPAITDETIVTGDAEYTATFTTVTNKYDITFVDEDGVSVLKNAAAYDYGTTVDQIVVPVVADKDGKKFAGWIPGLATVTGNQTYTAVYTDKIVITWKDNDGSVLKTQFYDGGETPCYAGEDVDPCTDEVPTKEGDAEWSYTFAGWSPDVVAVNGDATYTASYTSTKNTYAVTFYDEDGVTVLAALSDGPYAYGILVKDIAPAPTKAKTAEYTYTFAGWTPAVNDATIVKGAAEYTATYTATKNQYTVEFVMDDGVTPAATSVTKGYGTEIASLLPSDPTKAPTAAKTYEFDRWVVKVSDTQDQELEAGATLRAGMTLKAVFKEFDRKYLITFVDYDNTPRWGGGTLYVYGTAAADIAQPAPTRDPDDEFTYTFAGWTPAVTDVTGEQVYKATYTPTALGVTTYTITFTGDADVTGIPSPTAAAEGTSIATLLASVADPTKTSTVAKDYLFAGWVVVVDDETTAPIAAGATLTGDLTLKAVFTENDREYTVTFVGEDGVTGLPDAATVEYGVKVSTLLPTTNPTKGQTAQYTYSFSKWMIVDGNTMYDWTANTTVEGDMTLMAQFTSKARTYTITFVNGDKSETKVELVYDAMPEAPEAKLPANTAQYTYSFVAWEPAIAKVTGNKTYTAKINAVLNEYKITFLNYDNTELQSSNVKYGETPEYKGATPTKNPSATHTYTFDGWTPQVAAVTGVASYTAIFREEKIPVASSSSETVVSSSSEVPASSETVVVSSSSETTVVSSSATTVVSSSSVEPVVSSSSVTPVVSSSSEKVVASSSSVKPASSSSVQNKSSSSTKPASSSSSIKDKPKSSSSSKTDALYPTIAGGVKTIYANNELRISVAGTSPVKVQVFDMMGNLKESYQGVFAGEHVVSLSHLNRGNYIVRITGTGTLRNMKVSVR